MSNILLFRKESENRGTGRMKINLITKNFNPNEETNSLSSNLKRKFPINFYCIVVRSGVCPFGFVLEFFCWGGFGGGGGVGGSIFSKSIACQPKESPLYYFETSISG